MRQGRRLAGQGVWFCGRACPQSGGFHSAQTSLVASDAFVEALGNALTIIRFKQLAGVARIGDERDLGENRRHVGSDKDDEWGFLHAAILQSGVAFLQSSVEAVFDVRGKLAGLVDLVAERDLFDQIAELMDGLVRDRVLASGGLERVRRGSEVEVVGLDAARGRVRR